MVAFLGNGIDEMDLKYLDPTLLKLKAPGPDTFCPPFRPGVGFTERITFIEVSLFGKLGDDDNSAVTTRGNGRVPGVGRAVSVPAQRVRHRIDGADQSAHADLRLHQHGGRQEAETVQRPQSGQEPQLLRRPSPQPLPQRPHHPRGFAFSLSVFCFCFCRSC